MSAFLLVGCQTTGKALYPGQTQSHTISNLMNNIESMSGHECIGCRFVVPDDASPNLIIQVSGLSSNLGFTGLPTITESELAQLPVSQSRNMLLITKNPHLYAPLQSLSGTQILLYESQENTILYIATSSGKENELINAINVLSNYKNYPLDSNCVKVSGTTVTNCIDQTSCIDTDGGNLPFIKGHLISYASDGTVLEEGDDVCIDAQGYAVSESNMLVEWVCNTKGSPAYNQLIYDCRREGKICKDGACVQTNAACNLAGGTWKQFKDSCVDSCSSLFNPEGNCLNALTYGCDCGSDMCLDDTTKKCVSNSNFINHCLADYAKGGLNLGGNYLNLQVEQDSLTMEQCRKAAQDFKEQIRQQICTAISPADSENINIMWGETTLDEYSAECSDYQMHAQCIEGNCYRVMGSGSDQCNRDNDCSSTCALEGQNWLSPKKGCCAGLTQISFCEKTPYKGKCESPVACPNLAGGVCIKCGDGICSTPSYENICTCPQDCMKQGPALNNFRIENGKYAFDAMTIYTDFYIDDVKVSAEIGPNGGGAANAWYKIACKKGNLLEATLTHPASSPSNIVSYASVDISNYNCNSDKYPVINSVSGPTQLKVNKLGTWTVKAHDPENGYLSYSVKWNDENDDLSVIGMKKSASATEQTTTFTHIYSKLGTYTAEFTVTNDKNQIAKTTTTIKVADIIDSVSCIDTDGGNDIYNKGIITITDSTGSLSFRDSCLGDSFLVREYVCATDLAGKTINTAYTIVNTPCPKGCSDGACIGNECIDEGKSLGAVTQSNNIACCSNLTQISASVGTGDICKVLTGSRGYCTHCGDGVCKSPENQCNCPKDCKNICIDEGKSLGGTTPSNKIACCSNLTQISASVVTGDICNILTGSRGYCTHCGDGVCKSPENQCNCPKDCKDICIDTDNGEEYGTRGDTIILPSTGIDATVNSGETKTVNGVEISVLGMSNTNPSATIKVNGETGSVRIGETYTLGGIKVYIQDIMAYTAPALSGAVRMFIGSDRIVLENGNGVKTGASATEVDGTMVAMTASSNKISEINITVTPYRLYDQKKYIKPGESLVDPVFETFKWAFSGVIPALDSPSREEFKLYPSSNNYLTMEFKNRDGQKYVLNIFKGSENLTKKYIVYPMIDSYSDFITDGSVPIGPDDYFVITKNGYSHILQLIGIYNSLSVKEIRVRDPSTGGNTVSWTHDGTAGTMNYNGLTYKFNIASNGASITVDCDGNGAIGGQCNELYTSQGAMIKLPNYAKSYNTSANFAINFVEVTPYMTEPSNSDGSIISFPIYYDASRTSVNMWTSIPVLLSGLGSGLYPINEAAVRGLTKYGTVLWYDMNARSVEADYYGAETYYNVFLAPKDAVASTDGLTMEGGVKIENSLNKLHFDDRLDSLVYMFSSDNFPVLLKPGTLTDNDGTPHRYNSLIYTPNAKIGYGPIDSADSAPSPYIDFSDGNKYYKTRIVFSNSVNITKAANKIISMFGRDFTLSANANELGSSTVTMYGGGIDKTLTTGTKETIIVNNQQIPIEVIGVNTIPNNAIVKVNGETGTVKRQDTIALGDHICYIMDFTDYMEGVGYAVHFVCDYSQRKTDECISSGVLRKYYCSTGGTLIGEEEYQCPGTCSNGVCVQVNPACTAAGGTWKQFSDSCVDSCERVIKPYSSCLSALTYGCDCGPEKCYDENYKACMYDDCSILWNYIETSFGIECNNPSYIPFADLNKDGIVNIVDFSLFKANYNTSGWCGIQTDVSEVSVRANPCSTCFDTDGGQDSLKQGDVLQLLPWYVDVTITAGENKTVTVGTNIFEIQVIGVNTDHHTATIKVNGESGSVTEGETFSLGAMVYIKDIMADTAPYDTGAVRMFFGVEDGKRDYCNGQMIVEYSCLNNKTSAQSALCHEGCKDGACVKDDATTVCTDSDGGRVYDVKGYVNASYFDVLGEPYTGADYCGCINDDCSLWGLLEYYCKSDATLTREGMACPTGTTCSDGACVEHATTCKVIQEDNFFAISNNGFSRILQLKKIYNTSSIRNIQVQDTVIDKDTISWIHDSSGGSMNYDGKTYAFTLLNGAESITVCEVILCDNETCQIPCTDECSPIGTTKCNGDYYEETCSNYDADICTEWDVHSCQDGCVSGSCKATNINIKDTISEIKSNPQSYKQVIGLNSVEDNIAAVDLAGFLKIKNTFNDTQATVNDYLIVVGGPCVNKAAAELMGVPDTWPECAAGFQPNRGIIRIFSEGGKKQILVAGYSAKDTRIAARVLSRYLEFGQKLNFDQVMTYGTSLDDVNVQPRMFCSDGTPVSTCNPTRSGLYCDNNGELVEDSQCDFFLQSCVIGSGINCQEFKVTAAGAATVKITNGMGETMTRVSMTLGTANSNEKSVSIADGTTSTFTFTVGSGTVGSMFSAPLAINYTISTIQHLKTGKLNVKYE